MSLALGCLATDGLIGRSPRRFAIARKTVTPLVTSAAGTEAPGGVSARAGAVINIADRKQKDRDNFFMTAETSPAHGSAD